ncbi:MAG: HAMP domain-containing histidine kinase [Firmicutes bacterium]|nr:HAMP domain-containing histidine kinase [Bacillota bacterium]
MKTRVMQKDCKNCSIVYRQEEAIHNIKLLLTIIFAKIQYEELTAQPDMAPEFASFLSYMKKSSFKLIKIVNDATDLGRLSRGALSPRLRNYDVVALIRDLLETATPLATNKKLHLEFTSNICQLTTAVDKEMLERIMLNLLSNAIKFSHENGIITVQINEKPELVQISVADNGIGIPPNRVKDIFNRYVSDANSQNKYGVGVGLAVAQGLANSMQGLISVKSGDWGTIMTLSLPKLSTADEDEFRSFYSDFYSDNMVQIELSDELG